MTAQAAAKKTAPRKTTARKTTAKKATAKKAAAKKAAPRKTTAAKTPAAKPAVVEVPVPATSVEPDLQPAAEHEVPPHYVLIDPVWLERAYRLGVGSAVLAAASGGRVLGVPGGPFADGLPSEGVIDIGVGLSDSVFSAVQRSVDRLSRAVAPLADLLRPALDRLADRVAEAVSPAVEPIAERGRRRRAEAEAEMASLVESLIPDITDLMLERIDLQTVLSRIDLQELVEASLDHIDMQAVMAKMDMSQTVDQMMGQLDLTQIALDHVDMNRVMENAIKQVDMVALVRSQLEGMDLAELLIGTPTSLASGALRQTSRLVRRG